MKLAQKVLYKHLRRAIDDAVPKWTIYRIKQCGRELVEFGEEEPYRIFDKLVPWVLGVVGASGSKPTPVPQKQTLKELQDAIQRVMGVPEAYRLPPKLQAEWVLAHLAKAMGV